MPAGAGRYAFQEAARVAHSLDRQLVASQQRVSAADSALYLAEITYRKPTASAAEFVS